MKWVYDMKNYVRWKNKTQSMKIESLWFWFRLFLIFNVASSSWELLRLTILTWYGL